VQPAHADRLVRPQLGAQRIAGIDRREPIGRSRRSPSVPASSSASSASLSASPSSVTAARKSSSASHPRPPAGRVPTVAVACGRAGRAPPHAAGIRTTTPAASSRGVSASSRAASPDVQRSGWNSSPRSTISASHGQASAARRTGASSAASCDLARAPAYSRSAWPSGVCCAVARADSRVV